MGALKQADVGLALLSGYGNANTSDDVDNSETPEGEEKDAEKKLNEQAKTLEKRSKDAARVHFRDWSCSCECASSSVFW